MSRPTCVVNVSELPGEKRPRYTSTEDVAAIVKTPGDVTGLTQMGVHLRAVDPGFAGTNRHFHTVEEEWTYVLAGSGSVRIGPIRTPIRPGNFVGFPPGPRPHHFVADGDEPLILLEGGERRSSEDGGWYPDARKFWRAGKFVEPYEEPPPEGGDDWQVLSIEDLEIMSFQHDVEPKARREMRSLHGPTGLQRQAVYWARVAPGGLSTAFHTHDRTDEWIFVLSGRGVAHVGNDRFDVRASDFVGHPAKSAPHIMKAIDELTYLMGGQIDATDVVTYPDAKLQRVGGHLLSLP